MRQRILTILIASIVIVAPRARAQSEWLDTILPANNLLERLPTITVNGEEEPGGLFDFVDLNGDGKKDLILAYREQIVGANLELPHDQTLAICFYDPKGSHYVKLFEDSGPALSSIQVLTQSSGQRKIILVERGATTGTSLVRAFAVLQGKVTRLFEVKTPPVYVKAAGISGKVEIWVSSKKQPSSRGEAEKSFMWNDSKEQFLAKNGEALGDRVLEPTPTFTATSTATAVPPTNTPVPKKKKAVPTPTFTEVTVVKKPVDGAVKTQVADTLPTDLPVEPPADPNAPKAALPKGLKWWAEPFNPAACYALLRNELVPARVKGGQVPLLGQQAKSLFDEMLARGVPREQYQDFRAGYYTAVARAFKEIGQIEQAKYYLGMVQKSRPDFKEANDLRMELNK